MTTLVADLARLNEIADEIDALLAMGERHRWSDALNLLYDERRLIWRRWVNRPTVVQQIELAAASRVSKASVTQGVKANLVRKARRDLAKSRTASGI